MKPILALILIILFPLFANAQTKAINEFYRSHKKDKGTINLALPGFVIRLGASIARPHLDEEEIKIGLRFAKKMKGLKLLVAEDESTVTRDQYLQLVSEVKSNQYEELIMVHEGDTDVNIMVREKKDKIRGLLILVRESDSFVMMSMKTKFKMEDVNQLVKDIMREKLLKKKKEEPPKKSKPLPPQA